MYLFYNDGSLDASDYITHDDDHGVPSAYGWWNSYIALDLSAGNYVTAVSDFYLSIDDAIAGINTHQGSYGIGSGPYLLQIEANVPVTPTYPSSPVPIPGAGFLFLSGLAGLVKIRKKFI